MAHTIILSPWPARLPLGASIDYPDDTVLFTRGSSIRTLFYIADGVVTLGIPGMSNEIHVGFAGPGEVADLHSAVRGTRHELSARTLGRCSVCQIPAETLKELRQQATSAGQWMAAPLADTVSELAAYAAVLASGGAKARLQRLVVTLFRLASDARKDGSRRLRAHLSVTRAATLIGASRTHTSCLLSEWGRARVMVRERGWLVLPSTSPWIPKVAGQDQPS